MLGFIKKIIKISAVAVCIPAVSFGAQAPNPRGAGNARNSAVVDGSDVNTSIRRSATTVIARSAALNNRKDKKVVSSRSANVRAARPVVSGSVQSRAATVSGNSAKKTARSATVKSIGKKSSANLSRAAKARATAVYNDVTKIGGGYTSCHDAYATCMDQFCANANDTYRRCFCSDRFTGFRDTADALDQALTMLAEFQDNNLNAVDKTAAEVNAMYTASEGEAAIKRDTSASQKLLDNISNILSGKKSFSRNTGNNSLGVLDFSSFSTDSGDIFSDADGFSLFGGNSSNLSEAEGKELYNGANKQCVAVTREACPSESMFNLARSAYSILITQDCNIYEKNINAKRESVKETVRTAEKYLRDARLEEYRAHNSADVNACLAKVENAIKQPTACGSNYEKCLDYTGRYISTVTGEPIYSQALFGLNNLIVLNGNTTDVLSANKDFNKFLEEKKIFVTSALDNCRDISDTVWYEFKRSALIQIAQAQDEKIQAVKDSCVATIRECYDKQTGDLNELDSTDFVATGAISAVAARGMCYDRVMACAALYGDPDGCAYDDRSKKLTTVSGKKCGLQALLTFVDAVDSVKVAEGCQVSLEKYAHELCDPKTITDEDNPEVYPAGCKDTPRAQLRAAIEERARLFCAQDLVFNDESNTISDSSASFNLDIVNRVIKDLFDELDLVFTMGCESMGGIWLDSNAVIKPDVSELNQAYYRKYYGVSVKSATDAAKLVKKGNGSGSESGWCILDSMVKTQCLDQGQQYDEGLNDCILSADWYSNKCRALGGIYSNSQCEIQNVTSIDEFLSHF